MKKLTAAILSLALLLSMGLTALAADGKDTVTDSNLERTAPVYGKYVDNVAEPEIVYSIDIRWGSMAFTYIDRGTKTWDPDTHTYTYQDSYNSGNGYYSKWRAIDENEGGKIIVTNHSNAPISVTYAFTPVAGLTFKGGFDRTDHSTGKGEARNIPACAENSDPKEYGVALELFGSTIEDKFLLNKDTPVTIGAITMIISDKEVDDTAPLE